MDTGGSSKIGLFVLGFVALGAFLIWKVSSSSEEAAAVANRVVAPYLEASRGGDYAGALERHAAPSYRQAVDAEALRAGYAELTERHGAWRESELVRAQAHTVIGEGTTVRASYRLVFEDASTLVSFDVEGEGDAARIVAAYDRPVGRDALVPAAR